MHGFRLVSTPPRKRAGIATRGFERSGAVKFLSSSTCEAVQWSELVYKGETMRVALILTWAMSTTLYAQLPDKRVSPLSFPRPQVSSTGSDRHQTPFVEQSQAS